MKSAKLFASVLVLIALPACQSYVQTTSGEDYLSRYESSWQPDCAGEAGTLDEEIRTIASIEPNLQFPARIGLARLERGRLTAIPGDESAMWLDVAEELGPNYGDFVPVSPMIAAMVTPNRDGYQISAAEVVADIRRGAARQHLDYVFVYEVTATSKKQDNAFALADATIIGFFLLPGRNVKAEAVASGLMLDVRNGYPYATLTTYAEEKSLSRGSAAWGRMETLADTASEVAVAELVLEVEGVMKQLAVAAPETSEVLR